MSISGWRIFILAAVVLGSVAHAEDDKKYPRGELLIEPSELATRTDKYVVLDARTVDAYAKGHVPGAVHVDVSSWQNGFGQGNDATGWSRRIGQLGIDGKKPIVVYDDVGGREAARVWWILRYWGATDVKLLNGFWKGWKARNNRQELRAIRPKPAIFRAMANEEMFAAKRQVLEASKAGGKAVQIVDARTPAEYTGAEAKGNPRPGKIPGACNLDWTEVVDLQVSQRFKTSGQLKHIFANAKIDLERPIITHCQSGGRASVMAFAILLMGGKEVANYHPSFGEWSRDKNVPVEKSAAAPASKN